MARMGDLFGILCKTLHRHVYYISENYNICLHIIGDLQGKCESKGNILKARMLNNLGTAGSLQKKCAAIVTLLS